MAFRLIWTETAVADLQSIIEFIKSDNPDAARNIGLAILSKVESAAELPLAGRLVPEKANPDLREVLLSPFRIIYRVDRSATTVQVIRIWHAARGEPEIN